MIGHGPPRIFWLVTSPGDSSLVRCTHRLLSDRPVRACRYLKSALTHKSRMSSSASLAGSCTMRSILTISLNGSDNSVYLVVSGRTAGVADAHAGEHHCD